MRFLKIFRLFCQQYFQLTKNIKFNFRFDKSLERGVNFLPKNKNGEEVNAENKKKYC